MPLQDGGTEWDCPVCGRDMLFDCRCDAAIKRAYLALFDEVIDHEPDVERRIRVTE